jgi:succinyl-CoA synthetase beta subunit
VPAAGVLRGLEWVAEHLSPETPWARWQILLDGDSAAVVAARVGIPLVVKAAGRTIEHRTELGAVRFVGTEEGVSSAVDAVTRVCREHADAVMLQAAAAPGFEVLVSVVRDPEFGPVAFVRPGGAFAEVMKGQAVVWGGWKSARRLQVLQQSRIGELLSAYRGGTAYDVEGLADLLTTCLSAVNEDMSFLELNPVIVHEDGVTLVDAVARP